MQFISRFTAGLFLATSLCRSVFAAGSGLNVAVVLNQRSTNSIELANYYCEKRGVPPQNVFRMTNWAGASVNWTKAEFETYLQRPLLAALQHRGLSNQLDFVLLSMDVPYRVNSADANGTTSVLFYGHKTNGIPPFSFLPATCSLPEHSANSFAFQEEIFRDKPPTTAPTNSFLATMLTASNLATAKKIVDRAVAADGTFPTQTALLTKTTDDARNVRFYYFDDAVFSSRILGYYSLVRTNLNPGANLTNLLGLDTGLTTVPLATNAFLPGALADNLTSYGGLLFEPAGQTVALAFLNAGAVASYGTVIEPCNFLEKFPAPHAYFYQARGFSAAESYYMSLQNPFQGVLVGEPLAAPFARPAAGDWLNLPAGALLTGRTNLTLQFTAADTNRPVQQVDLFLDGRFLRTLTNLPPAEGNTVTVTLNGQTLSHTVAANATLRGVVTNLADTLNAASNLTGVVAFPIGDRLELQGVNLDRPGALNTVSVSNDVGRATHLTTRSSVSRPTFLDTTAWGYQSIEISNSPAVGEFLRLDLTKTNGALVTLTVTNTAANGEVGQVSQALVTLINAHPALTGADGVIAEDYDTSFVFSNRIAYFNLRARSPGWKAAQAQAVFTGSSGFRFTPAATNRLDGNAGDLHPRDHLFITAGLTNLPLTFALDTMALPDGFHELTAVAYEGSHVRTQKRVSRQVVIRNTTLDATLSSLIGQTNAAVEATLQFRVETTGTAGSPVIELFSTGGSLGRVTNLAATTFTVPAATLGVGLHPFYAVVSDSSGRQFRTATQWLRLIREEAPFRLSATGLPGRLDWPAVPGRRYEVLTATNLAQAFQVTTSVVPSSATAVWSNSYTPVVPRYFRVRSAP